MLLMVSETILYMNEKLLHILQTTMGISIIHWLFSGKEMPVEGGGIPGCPPPPSVLIPDNK